MPNSRSRTAPGASRDKLLEAAIDLFGLRGLDGVSTREIAARAGVNIAGIAYQFGGKEELYRACVAHIAETVRSNLVQGALAQTPDIASLSPQDAKLALRLIMTRAVRFLVAAPELDRFASIIVREQMNPTPAFETLYANVFEPMHRLVCALWARVIGEEPESESVKLATFSLLGQVLFFLVARAGSLRRLGWQSIGPDELAKIEKQLTLSLDAVLTSNSSGGPL